MSGESDWLALLRAHAAATNITQAAKAIGMSRTAVSLALAGKYPGGTQDIAARVMAILAPRPRCPGLEREITAAECRDWAAKPFAATNTLRVRMHAACRRCPNRPQGGEDAQ